MEKETFLLGKLFLIRRDTYVYHKTLEEYVNTPQGGILIPLLSLYGMGHGLFSAISALRTTPFNPYALVSSIAIGTFSYFIAYREYDVSVTSMKNARDACDKWLYVYRDATDIRDAVISNNMSVESANERLPTLERMCEAVRTTYGVPNTKNFNRGWWEQDERRVYEKIGISGEKIKYAFNKI